MRRYLYGAILLLAWASCLQAAPLAPAVPGTAGQRAFEDLARFYSDRAGPNLSALWQQLHATDPAVRQAAGDYLRALCEQSFADEATGRTAHSRLPPAFGGRSPSYAREFRKQLAEQCPDHAAVAESLPALRWLLEQDILAETHVKAMATLRQIHDPAADKLLLELLDAPHPNGQVLTMALEEAAARKLQVAGEVLRPLTVHYRAAVRRVAQALAAGQGLTDLPAYSPESALHAAFDPVLRQITAMVLTPIPAEAPFVQATLQSPARGNRPASTYLVYGWLLGQTADAYRVLDEYAVERNLPKDRTTLAPETLAARARGLRELREEEARAAKSRSEGSIGLSRNGALSGQFEPREIRLPEILIGAWAYQHQDAPSAALVLLPRLDELADARWFREIARDLLGHYYHQQMLTRLADYWDYPGTLRLAQHLSSPVFDGFEYQYRAESLLAQLPRWAEKDFRDRRLPTPAEWHRQRRQLPRREQITFLAERLHLISVRQTGWPTLVNLRDELRSVPCNGNIYAKTDPARGTEVINPYVELRAMTLAPSELPILIPYLADDDYLLTYHCWRPWHPAWEMFHVNELIEALINDAAGRPLADLRDYYTTAEPDRPAYLRALTEKATQARPRLLRAALDFKALGQNPADPILGFVSCLAACAWYAWRRALPGIACLGAAVLLAIGIITLWYPALQHQRVWLHADALVLLLAAGMTSILLGSRLDGSARRGLLLALAAGAAAWFTARYFYIDPLLNPYALAAAVLLLWPLSRMLRRSRRGWVWFLMAALFGALALANSLWIEVAVCRRYHLRLPPEFEPPLWLSHPVWTAAVLLACICFLQGLRRQWLVPGAPSTQSRPTAPQNPDAAPTTRNPSTGR